ncbi:MAG: beta-ketoacyl-ACP synthase III [Burkholderiaceae bacterium]|nr:beta-ketoacyl-ACP synthase III [Burkholderiaceae bacterium]
MTIYSKIIGTGSYLPPRRVTNEELVAQLAAKGVETSDEWIVSRSGITSRHYADPGVLSSDLGVEAAKKALEMAKLQTNDVDLILLATTTPDHLGGFPSTACRVQAKLGIENHCAAVDIQAVCSGFVYAMSMADAFIRAGIHKNILVVATEIYSRVVDFNDRSTCVLFGDGAGAVVVSASEQPGILATKLHADGTHNDILHMDARLNCGVLEGSGFMYMDGQAVFKQAVTVLDQVGHEVMELAGVDPSQIDWLIPHQANVRIMQSAAKRLKIPTEKVVITVDWTANTSAATIPIALDTAMRDGRIKSGQNILMAAIGGGLTWGAVLARM